VDLGEPIATGRDADIFDAGVGRVLRRNRRGQSQAREARLMQYVVDKGYPAPTVHEVSDDGLELVMQRVEGPTMLDDIGDHPWRMRRHARTLAELHTRLGQLPAPSWLGAGPVPGDRVVHLDLHPGNVIVTPDGPVVIDWTNGSSGTPGSDVATTWLVMACADIPGPRWKAVLLGAFRRVLVADFVRHAGRDAAVADLPAVAAWKTADRNMRPTEVEAMHRFVEKNR
jgi:aminoglycoside phosphotransferase (APT) family kinase protein